MDSIKYKGRSIHILLVEDNMGDVILTKRAFKAMKFANELMVAGTGEQALQMLLKEEEYNNIHVPDLILLDLNLPQMKGLELLQLVKENSELRSIPIIILSSSKAEQDIIKSYKLYVNAYMVKPVNIEKFKQSVQKIESFWFDLVLTPERDI